VTERQWELYRLSVVKEAPESPRKAAVITPRSDAKFILVLEIA
jgi:hypothetical protein